MSDAPKDFLLRLNDGRESAFEDFDRRYRRQLCALVEKEMGKRFAAREDPEDAAQSAMASFCRGVKEKRFHIDQSSKLWGLLATITCHKILKHIEYHDAGKRRPGDEVRPEGDVFHSREPSPEEAAHVANVIEQVVQGLRDPDPEIFRLRLEGYTRKEIAKKFDMTEANVKCRLDRIRDRLGKLLARSQQD
jgi:RNA polymerase sigma factor (sigma-70 family)